MSTSRKLALVLGLGVAAVAGSAQAAYGYTGYREDPYDSGAYGQGYGYNDGRRTVRCESRDNRTVHCGVDTRGGVRLVDQMSRSSCVRGRTWGTDRHGIWVSRGCRGRFELRNDHAYGGDAYGQGIGALVRCESRDGRTNYCGIDTRHGVQLVNQISRDPCIEGRSWGVSRSGLWVSRGCRGDFAIGTTGRGYDYGYRY